MTRDAAYSVEIEVFQGPFDLLLKAIDDGSIEVHQVSIAQITSSYFDYWKRQGPPLVAASDFLFMAAYLLELKSRSLLPAREDPQDGDMLAGVEESLVSHIQEYEVFKNLAQTLKERKEVFGRIFGRHEGERREREIELTDVSLRDLVLAFQKAYKDAEKRESIVNIAAEEVSLEERIAEIRNMLEGRNEGIPFEDIFIRRTRLEVVVTFLAILELTKQSMIRIAQGTCFGSILIIPRKEKEGVIGEEDQEHN